ncbi:LOW QUALITY PROTEIN: hypothetical protein ACHAXA_003556 [Cyclostephanos tholiformis]|uniref:Uncharacterized protein n=1 Tax=Cyclostephanos tholiformis TaxID=382380 RepID=A0ABD3R5N2_9STRA
MDVIAAIQAAKNQLEAEKSRKQSMQVQNRPSQPSPNIEQSPHTTSATTATTNLNNNNAARGREGYSSSSSSHPPRGAPPPPTNVVSFDSARRQPQPQQQQQLPLPAEYVPWGSLNGGGSRPYDDVDDGDSITSSLSGTLPGETPPPQEGHTAGVDEGSPIAGDEWRGVVRREGDERRCRPPHPPLSCPGGGVGAGVAGPKAPLAWRRGRDGKERGGGGGGDDDDKRRIEEIMSAYKGKVDNILRRQQGGSEEGVGMGGGIVSPKGRSRSFSGMVSGASASGIHNEVGAAASTTAPTRTKTNNDGSGEGGGESKIDDILSTYKKRVGEIMSKNLTTTATTAAATGNPFSSSPRSSVALAVDEAIPDDGGIDHDDVREGAVDMGNGNSTNVRSMSERANAILQTVQEVRHGGVGSGGDHRTRSMSTGSDGGRSRDSYISGASSASEMSSLIEGAAHGYNQQPPRQSPAPPQVNDMTGSSGPAAHLMSPSPAKRKDSLSRAQAVLTESATDRVPKSWQSFSHRNDNTAVMTKGTLYSEIEDERKRRLELEKRIAEANQREEELSRENRRLEKNWSEVKSQLDIVQAELRSNKYSLSEQASRIKDLERKLKNEKDRYEELERERDAMKEEYDQDLEEQKDINRQLEQMVMSEEFEKELEDEINQVKELEHANRRFKVKIEMLEREKSTIVKKYDAKIEEYTNKVTSLEEQYSESETRARQLEEKARKSAEEWDVKLADEKSHARDVQNDLEKAETKLKGMEAELAELRDSCSKIDEYEQVLGKLMERNEELETEVKEAKDQVKGATDEIDMANRQVELIDRRRAAKIKHLEEKIEEQRVVIEQQQETLDESVKTILKLYSLNNTRSDDLSVMSEEKLTDMARAMVPRLGANQSKLSPIHDEDRGGMSLLPGYTNKRPNVVARSMTSTGINSTRRRELTEEVENLRQRKSRARSTGRSSNLESSAETLLPMEEYQFKPRPSRTRSTGRSDDRNEIYNAGDSLTLDSLIKPRQSRARSTGRTQDRSEIYNDADSLTMDSQIKPRHMSRGRRGERTESIRQLTDRARTPAQSRSLSPITPRPSASHRLQVDYDPTGPASQSRALVPVIPKESDDPYGGQYNDPPRRSSTRRELVVDRDRGAMYDPPYNESTTYVSRQPGYDKHQRPRSRSAHRSRQHVPHHSQSFGSGHPSHRDRREESERKDSYRHEGDQRERDRGGYRSDQNRERDGRDRDSDRNIGRGANDFYYRGRARQGRSGVYPPKERNSSYRSGGGYGNHREEASSRRYARDPSTAGDTIISDDGGGGGGDGGWRGMNGTNRDRGRAQPRREP